MDREVNESVPIVRKDREICENLEENPSII